MYRLRSAALSSLLVVTLAACGGGGSSPPGTLPAGSGSGGGTTTGGGGSGSSGSGAFSLVSVPVGLPVTVKTSAGTQHLVAPASVTPKYSNSAFSFTFAPSNGRAAYAYVSDQRGIGGTVLYNQVADTTGSIASVSASAIARRVPGAHAAQPQFRIAYRTLSHGAAGRPAFSATRLIVHYRTDALASRGIRAADVERSERVMRGIDVGPVRDGLAARVVEVTPGDTVDALAARLRTHAEVASVARERLFYKESTTPVSVNDPFFENVDQWNLFDIGAPNAWGYTTGKPANQSGPQIAIVDTGADVHATDLAGKVTYAEKYVNGTLTVGTAAAQDTDGHGTNVAAVAAADTNNSYGIAGVGYNVGLQIYRVFPDGTTSDTPKYEASANESDVAQAIYDAVAHGAKVINLSLGSCQAGGPDGVEAPAVAHAIASNVVVVAASGNERSGGGSGNCKTATTVDFPAADPGVISVGATSLHDSAAPKVFGSATEYVASYSNSGPGLSVVAPGGDPTNAEASDPNPSDVDPLHWITSLDTTTAVDPTNRCTNTSQCFALFAGTSEATPHVAGAAALMLSLKPNLTPAAVLQTLVASADNIGDANQGHGRLDAYRALAVVAGDPNPPQLPGFTNFVAIAYVPNGTNVPQIVDATYTRGAPVASSGAFRVADIPQTASGYKIAVWDDANGDGRIDAGDYFAASATCAATAPCASAAGLVPGPVPAGFIP